MTYVGLQRKGWFIDSRVKQYIFLLERILWCYAVLYFSRTQDVLQYQIYPTPVAMVFTLYVPKLSSVYQICFTINIYHNCLRVKDLILFNFLLVLTLNIFSSTIIYWEELLPPPPKPLHKVRTFGGISPDTKMTLHLRIPKQFYVRHLQFDLFGSLLDDLFCFHRTNIVCKHVNLFANLRLSLEYLLGNYLIQASADQALQGLHGCNELLRFSVKMILV